MSQRNSVAPTQCVKRAVEPFAEIGVGNIKRLQGIDPPEFRLRVSDYRVRFHRDSETLLILRVRNRREAYRKGLMRRRVTPVTRRIAPYFSRYLVTVAQRDAGSVGAVIVRRTGFSHVRLK